MNITDLITYHTDFNNDVDYFVEKIYQHDLSKSSSMMDFYFRVAKIATPILTKHFLRFGAPAALLTQAIFPEANTFDLMSTAGIIGSLDTGQACTRVALEGRNYENG